MLLERIAVGGVGWGRVGLGVHAVVGGGGWGLNKGGSREGEGGRPRKACLKTGVKARLCELWAEVWKAPW